MKIQFRFSRIARRAGGLFMGIQVHFPFSAISEKDEVFGPRWTQLTTSIGLVLWLSLTVNLAAQETPSQLSPDAKSRLRAEAARSASAGYPQLPPADALNWRLTASLEAAPLWTQDLAIVVVRVVLSNQTVMVRQTNGTMAPFLSNKRPLIISVTTQRFDIFRAPEVVRPEVKP